MSGSLGDEPWVTNVNIRERASLTPRSRVRATLFDHLALTQATDHPPRGGRDSRNAARRPLYDRRRPQRQPHA
jgi:hypothetical protein